MANSLPNGASAPPPPRPVRPLILRPPLLHAADNALTLPASAVGGACPASTRIAGVMRRVNAHHYQGA